MFSAKEQLNAGPSSKKLPIAFPQTYQELLQVITILGNGAYGERRTQLMTEGSETFDRMRRIEQRLITATGMGPAEDPIHPSDVQAVIELFGIMEVPSSPEAGTPTLTSAVTNGRESMGHLFERTAV